MINGVYNNKNRVRGFSLIELMVALTIFSVVMTVSIGTLLVLIDANTKAQALSTAMTNISFALDSMSRNIRTGTRINCANGTMPDSQPDRLIQNHNTTRDCTGGSLYGIVFTPGTDLSSRVGYRLNNGQIEQWYDRSGVTDGWVPITSNQAPTAVAIENLQFTVDGSANTSSDYRQPRVSLLIKGSVDSGLEAPTEFEIQTNVTQRVLNY